MSRWLINLTVLVLAVLAGSTAYFATKASVLEGHLARRELSNSKSTVADGATSSATSATTISPVPTTTTQPSTSPSPTTSTATVATSDRLAKPSETYTVVAGDTLYPISLKYNMSLERLAEANGLIDPFPLKIGQILAIPEVNAKENIFEVRLTTDPTQASVLQNRVASGAEVWRLDPLQVAKAEHSGLFGLTASDDFRQDSKDDTAGTAIVTATRLVASQTKTYQISLVQPATKGSNGIWAITKITPKGS